MNSNYVLSNLKRRHHFLHSHHSAKDSPAPSMTDSAICATNNLSPLEATQAARKLWLSATSQSDLDEVERLYRWALSSKTTSSPCHPHNHDDRCGDSDGAENDKYEPCGLKRSDYMQAGEKLALLLCQSGRSKKAKKGLSSRGYTCRLSEKVLDYPFEGEEKSSISDTNNTDAGDGCAPLERKQEPPCQIIDGFLSRVELDRLRFVFESPTASYWTDHNYAVEPPSPYFSYVIPLSEIEPWSTSNKATKRKEIERGRENNGEGNCSSSNSNNNKFGFMGQLIQRVRSCPILNKKFPKLVNAAYVEMWAHNRPHASGHQMHFDSDDEGRGGVRNPIISTILYISAGNGGDETMNADNDNTTTTTPMTETRAVATGGPSLVTNQKLTDIRLATHGWMCHPKLQRLVAFDGRYLHGVVPGKGVQEGRRVTLMFAFWEDIRIRSADDGPGSARPFPCSNDFDDSNVRSPEWASWLTKSMNEEHNGDDGQNYRSCVEIDPITLDVVYEALDGKPWKRGMGMPSYDEVFQGF